MAIWSCYLDGIEEQVRTDGFMTNAMRRNLDRLRQCEIDEDVEHRIHELVLRYHRPYASGEFGEHAVSAMRWFAGSGRPV